MMALLIIYSIIDRARIINCNDFDVIIIRSKNTRQVNSFKPPLIRQQRTRLVKAQLLWFLLARLSLRKMDTLLLGGRVKVDIIM